MTPDDKLIQEQRRKIAQLEAQIEEFKSIHMQDLAQLAYYRRQIDFLMDAAREGKP